MAVMATEPTKKSKDKKRPPKRRGKPLHLWLNSELHDEFTSYVASLRPRVTATAIVEDALAEYLAKRRSGADADV